MEQAASDIDTLLEVMRRRRNNRRYRPDPVPDEYINLIIEAARLAPSGANTQPWEFIVIRDPARKKEIAQIFADALGKGRGVDPKFPSGTEEMLRRKYEDAPILIAVCADPRLKEAYPGYGFRDSILYISMGAAMQHMHLAAAALGLAMCWGTVSRFTEEPLGELLGVPPPLIVKEVFTLGFPIAEVEAKYRRGAADVVHIERMDPAKLRSEEELARAIANRRTPDIFTAR